MKRNRQQKFRIKLIQELHLNKEQQKELDNIVSRGIATYTELCQYKDYGDFEYPYILLKYILNQIKSALVNPYHRMIDSFRQSYYEYYKSINKLGGDNDV